MTTITDAIEQVLRDEEKPLNHSAIYNRIVAKGYYEFGAKDPKSVVRGKLRKHCVGIDFPSASPKKLFIQVKTANKKPLYELWDGEKIPKELPKITSPLPDEELPEERIQRNHKDHIKAVKSQLLDYIKNSDPAFFESLVVKLLIKMGYGWDSELAGRVVGGPFDGGIDGIISEDKLELENIYIQAKRKQDKTVSAEEVRGFAGAMAAKGATKGIFFTPTTYSRDAKKFVNDVKHFTIRLVDGDKLSDLLIEHKLGVILIKNIEIFEIDRNYFSID